MPSLRVSMVMLLIGPRESDSLFYKSILHMVREAANKKVPPLVDRPLGPGKGRTIEKKNIL